MLSAMVSVDSGVSLSAARKRCVPSACTSSVAMNSHSHHIILRKKQNKKLIIEFDVFVFYSKRLLGA